MKKNMLVADQARVKEFLHYDEMTGIFTWKKRPSNRVRVGDVAKQFNPVTGYLCIGFDGHRFLAHRLAWLYVHGEMPPAEIDHINGLPADNRIANLRLATHAENGRNSRRRKSSSGLKGTRWRPERNVWVGQIKKDGKNIFLGHFATAEEAHAAYAKAAAELHGQFARTA
jgi:hypothetical protein